MGGWGVQGDGTDAVAELGRKSRVKRRRIREEKEDVQAYDAKYDNQPEMEDISDSKREAQDDAEDADPLAVDTCWRRARVLVGAIDERRIE